MTRIRESGWYTMAPMSARGMLPAVLLSFVLSAHTAMGADTLAENAESGSLLPESATGRTVADILTNIQQLIPDRAPRSLKETTVAAKIADSWSAESAMVRKRQAEHRRECAEALRRANRDTIMSVSSQCMRSELLLEMNLLRKEQQYIEAIPFADPLLRDKAQGQIAELLKAEAALIDGIDAGIFIQIDSLKEAKRNLHSQYRQQKHLAVMRVRMDRERTWIALVARRLTTLLQDEPSWTQGQALEGALCLESAAKTIDTGLLAPDLSSSRASFLDLTSGLSRCRVLLKSNPKKP